jgi:glycosyltransferase involved in cell wall biosynthesis
LGHIEDWQILASVYRQHDLFALPSFHESFGLVYIEALSQGLPIVHSRYEGPCGFFPEGTVAESVDPTDPEGIASAIDRLFRRRVEIHKECRDQARKFVWSKVAAAYSRLYLNAAPQSDTLGRRGGPVADPVSWTG